MTALIKKIHMYLGLLSFSILLVFGIAGLTETFHPAPQQRERPEPAVTTVPFDPPPNASDAEVARQAYTALNVSLSAEPPDFAVRRDREHNVAFNLYHPSGVTSVTVLEKEKVLRVSAVRNGLTQFLNNLHATTIRNRAPDLRLRLWTFYTEFSIWALLAMAVTGVWLWLGSRPRHRIAQLSFALGSGSFLLLYFLTR